MRLFLIVFCGLVTQLSFAQIRISGSVSDPVGQGVSLAVVLLESQQAGTATNNEGNFTLEIEDINFLKDTLRISCLGFATQRLAIETPRNQSLNIILKPSVFSISEANIVSEKGFSAAEVVKIAIKKSKKTHLHEDRVFQGYYRELLFENGTAVELGEASFDLKYSPYPKKRASKRAFNYYYDQYFLNENSKSISYWSFPQFRPVFVSPKDVVNLTAARVSQKRGSENGLIKEWFQLEGGPMSLITLDNLKYQRHFFDPKLRKDYSFAFDEAMRWDGEEYWVVKFWPKDGVKSEYFGWNKRFQFAAFSGKIYIRKSDFAVRKFEVVDPDRYESMRSFIRSKVMYNYIPKTLGYSVEYQQTDVGWTLWKASYWQDHQMPKFDLVARHERELVLSKPVQKAFEEDSPNYFPVLKESLRKHAANYDTELWQKIEKSEVFVPLPEAFRKGLEKFSPLSAQWEYLNKEITAFEKPSFLGKKEQLFQPNSFDVKDSLAMWEYVRTEDQYAQEVLAKLEPYQKEWRLAHRKAFREIYDYRKSEAEPSRRAVQYYQGLGENGVAFWYEQDSAQRPVEIMRLATEQAFLKNGRLLSFDFSKNNIGFFATENAAISNTLKIKQKKTQELVDSITNVGQFFLVNDSLVLYTAADENGKLTKCYLKNMRSQNRTLLHEETSIEFGLELEESHSDNYIFLKAAQNWTDEVWAYHKAKGTFTKIADRKSQRKIVPYHFEGQKDFLFVVDQLGHKQRLERKSMEKGNETRVEFLFETEGFIKSLLVVSDQLFLVLSDIFVEDIYHAKFPPETDQLSFQKLNTLSGIKSIEALAQNSEDKTKLDFTISGLDRPYEDWQLDLETGVAEMVFRPRFSDDRKKYPIEVETLFAISADGTNIPILVAYDKTAIDSTRFLIIEGYGAYGAIMSKNWSTLNLGSMRSGAVLAWPAVRGTGQLGVDWHKSGTVLEKENTWLDFVACTKQLQAQYLIGKERTFARGTSAGGLLMGVLATKYADLYQGLILDRPFLDVQHMMKDSTHFLTLEEYPEFGNPNKKDEKKYIESYSPAQHILDQKPPHLFLVGAEFDRNTPLAQVLPAVLDWRQFYPENKLIFRTHFGQNHYLPYSGSARVQEYAFMRWAMESD